jgi:hypothetical protein
MPRQGSAARLVSIAAWTLAAMAGGLSLVLQGHPIWAAAALGSGGGLVLLSYRRRASSAVNALYTASADYLTASGKKMPGQLSLTAQEVVWMPSGYSRRHGQTDVEIPLREGVLSLTGGPGLLDVVVVVTGDHRSWQFGTHRSRRLRAVVMHLGGSA